MIRALLAACALGACALAGAACAEVKPWQRGALAEPGMDPEAPDRRMAREFVRHTLDVREGASGGDGTAGGGCGCN